MDTGMFFTRKRGGCTAGRNAFPPRNGWEDVIQQIAAGCNRSVNEQMPILDARLAGGERVSVVMAPVALNGPILTIRKFPEKPLTMDTLTAWDSITREAAEFLRELVMARYTILVGGGTSTGKTTFLNALSRFIPEDERIVTIEDTAELQLQGTDNLVRLEVRPENLQGGREIGLRELIRTALRMRPGRIIGEVRGGEAADFLNCLNTGHEGSLGSAHANSIRDMIGRLEMMALMGQQLPAQVIRRQIAAGIEILVHLGKGPPGEKAGSGDRRDRGPSERGSARKAALPEKQGEQAGADRAAQQKGEAGKMAGGGIWKRQRSIMTDTGFRGGMGPLSGRGRRTGDLRGVAVLPLAPGGAGSGTGCLLVRGGEK